MPTVLIVDRDVQSASDLERALRSAGHHAAVAASEPEAMHLLADRPTDVVIMDLALHVSVSVEQLRQAYTVERARRSLVIAAPATTANVLDAMRLGAADFLPKPVVEGDVHDCMVRVLSNGDAIAPADDATSADLEAHAAARWASAVVRIVDCPHDLRTISEWGRWIGASLGAIRNWCYTARIGSRRSLVFGRMLRAFILSRGARHKFENLLDVVDRRTLRMMLTLAGLQSDPMPADVSGFLERQVLVRDPVALEQVERAIRCRAARRRGVSVTATTSTTSMRAGQPDLERCQHGGLIAGSDEPVLHEAARRR